MSILLTFMLLAILPSSSGKKSIEQKGMKISWEIKESHIRFEVFAPTKGWIAIGLNQTTDLIGTNLIMGCVMDREAIISDRYIVGAGDHRSVDVIGGMSHVNLTSGSETEKGTSIIFTIASTPADEFHYSLLAGKQLQLLMAYSQEDDFAHHSIMRTSTKIIL